MYRIRKFFLKFPFIIQFYRKLKIDEFRQSSWSQEGEDMILARIFDGIREGFYVDVGAHHPKRFSNTYKLYRQGWSGINIEADGDLFRKFRRARRRDINLNLMIGAEATDREFVIFEEPALNSADPGTVFAREADVVRRVLMRSVPLTKVLDEHVGNRKIDLLSVDVEGLDLEVLRSNDWSCWRPSVVVIEALGGEEIFGDPCSKFLIGVGYVHVGASVFSRIFALPDVLPT